MRKHGLIPSALMLTLAVLLGSAACSQYDGTDRWEGKYLPESEIDRPKGTPMMMAADAGRPDGGDGAVADGATVGDAAPADAGAADSAPAADAANGDAAAGDAAAGDAAPADAQPAG